MKLLKFWLIGLLGISFCFQVWAQKLEKSARKLSKTHKKSIVVIKIVANAKYSIDGQEPQSIELKKEFTGIVINPKGLALASHSNIDVKLNVRGVPIPEEKVTTEISSVKMILSKGKEIDCKVILRDKDLDLAFFMPTEEVSSPFSYIPLKNKKVKAKITEDIIVLDLIFNIPKNPVGTHICKVNSIIKKPRTIYLSDEIITFSSAPVFKGNGSLLGIILQQNSSGRGSSKSFFAIVPVKEIIEAVKQAKDEMGK